MTSTTPNSTACSPMLPTAPKVTKSKRVSLSNTPFGRQPYFGEIEDEETRMESPPGSTSPTYNNIEDDGDNYIPLPAHGNVPSKETAKCVDWGGALLNYTEAEYADLWNYNMPEYTVIGKEICPNTGTPHLHFYFHFPTSMRWTTLKNKFPRAHLFMCKGTPDDNIAYCTKGEGVKIMGKWNSHGLNADWQEKGIKPSIAKKLEGMDEYFDTMFNQLPFLVDPTTSHDDALCSLLDVHECAHRIYDVMKQLAWGHKIHLRELKHEECTRLCDCDDQK